MIRALVALLIFAIAGCVAPAPAAPAEPPATNITIPSSPQLVAAAAHPPVPKVDPKPAVKPDEVERQVDRVHREQERADEALRKAIERMKRRKN